MSNLGASKAATAPNPLKKNLPSALGGGLACRLFAQTVANVHRAAKESISEPREILQKKIAVQAGPLPMALLGDT
jgi:hypothetical protein